MNKRSLQSIAVYCGSNPGNSPQFLELARSLGAELARRNIALVYGGGNMGMMGELARTVMTAGGHVTGVIPQALNGLVNHTELSALEITVDMHQRKARMMELADGFIVLPGGIGTMEEFFEVCTWQQLGYHQKPIGLLDCNDFYQPLLLLLDQFQAKGFLRPEHRQSILYARESADIIDLMAKQEIIAKAKLSERL